MEGFLLQQQFPITLKTKEKQNPSLVLIATHNFTEERVLKNQIEKEEYGERTSLMR